MSVVDELNPYAPPAEAPDGGPGAVPQAPDRTRSRIRPGRPAGATDRRSARPAAPLPPRQPMPHRTSVVVTALLVLALLAGWFLLQVFVLSGLSQGRSQAVLHAELRQQLAAQTAPTGGALDPGTPVALLEIPTLGLQQVVVEGTAGADLMMGPGHRRDTVLPGQAGIAIVYGRAASYGGPFRILAQLREGDGVTVTTGQGEFVYRVDGVRREGDPLPVALGQGGARLTLVTAEGQGVLAAVAPDRTVYVDATLVGDAATGPGGRPAAVPGAEKAFAADPGVLPVFALSLQVLLVAAVVTVLALRRLPGRAVWVLAVPVLVAAAWLAADSAVQLLPNLL
ncbi:sortase [Actinotalea sp.]|uniref:sortase n=1 Tax=Actinotalea sp. TaxID=1872145 RepID=UPI002B66FF37|nr:sortase [Actinotalea sp.]HRA50284.1 sortase [Actinotalea sp.]